MIWNPHDWLNKFCSLYITPVVGIVSRHSFRVEVHCINQPKLVFFMSYVCHGELCHDVLYVTIIVAYPVYVRVSVCVLRNLKKLPYSTGEWIWVISNGFTTKKLNT